MKRFQLLRLVAVLALVAVGCSGGCGCDGMTPVPGGFPVEERPSNAVAVKLSKGAFDMLEDSVAPLVEDALGGQLGAGVPCTDATQTISVKNPVPIGPPTIDYDIKIFACDLNEDQACNAADEDPALRVDQPGHGPLCGLQAQMTGMTLRPTQANASAPVDLEVVVQMQINTGRIPLVIHNPCTLRCALEIDTDKNSPPYIPVTARVRFRLDPNRGDILAFDVFVDDIMGQIDEDEIEIHKEGGACGFTCDVLNVDFVKRLLFDRIQGMVEEQITGLVDGFRCAPCEGGCPAGSACDAEAGVCYNVDGNGDFLPDGSCPANFLGMEGRLQLATVLGEFGAPPEAGLDLSVVAGGRDPETDRPTHRVESQGLVVGLMGGTRSVAMGAGDGLGDRVPAQNRCVPLVEWEERPPQTTLNFDQEAQTASGEPIADYHLGFGIGDNFLDKLFFDVWDAGALCLNIDNETVDLLSTGLFSTFLPSLDVLIDGRDVPLRIALRPSTPPHVVIGKGTTKPGSDGGLVPDDPLLTISLEGLNIDFYALIEERWSRLFTLTTDVRIPFGLDIDTANGTVTPALGALDAMLSNTRASNSEMLAEDPSALASLVESLMGLIQPALGGGLGPIDLPTGGDGFGLEIQALRGAVKYAQGEGYEYLAGFAKLQLDTLPFPATNTLGVEARLVDVQLPPVEAVVAGAIPTAVIEARGVGAVPNDFAGHEYSYRVNRGPWSPWRPGGRLEVSKPVMRLQGTHRVEVRVREAGVPESTSPMPAVVEVVVDHVAPSVRLELDHATRTVQSVARDAVAHLSELSFRYRANDGAWTTWGPARAYTLSELGPNPALEAEVRDPSGNLAAARFGHVSVSTTTSTGSGGTTVQAQAGCTHAAASLLSLLGLVALRRRRRR